MLEPRRVLRWVWLGRVVLSCAILVAAVFVWSEAAPSDTLIATLAFACATLATIGSVLYSEFERRALGMGFYAIQCAIDLALVTAAVHITGGWSSQFAALYILVIACAALLLPFRGGLAVAANSGGTNISYVDLRAGTTGREVFRYALPNIVAYSITTVRSQATDAPMTQRTVYDFSDRPQYLAVTCNGATTPGAPCRDIIAVYSTTPTPGQSVPFPNQGTLRWENLTQRTSHFFFEQAIGQSEGRSDTLEVERFAAAGFGKDSLLLPYKQNVPNGSGGFFPYSVVVRLDKLAFRDTTFVRGSGNFRRAVVGEGGSVLGSRAMTYDATMGMDSTPPTPVIDRGISRPLDVTNFVANTFSRVQGVGINFDGELNAVKGDSTYLFDRTLRLQGILQSRPSGGGLDLHPLNTGANSTLRTRLAFIASSEPVIDVFDTYCYRKIATIPIRDPIIGPVRATTRPNGQLVLVGATIRGVTVVALPDNFTTSCQ